MTEHICPAEIPDDVAEHMMAISLAAHRLLGCAGTSRSDFRWDDMRGKDGVFLLEVNTQPGMTPLSLVPEQARYLGMDYGALVEAIIAEALADGGST
jgi:D-alanine-D-alanine ligase